MYMPNLNLPVPDELLQRLDAVRGSVPRTVYIREAITVSVVGDEEDSQSDFNLAKPDDDPTKRRPYSPPVKAQVQQTKPRDVLRSSECSHPPNQRIGNVCMVCDAKVGK